MWIKEIIIEGFKSYAQRTVISGFDPKFNAITGLNGSGKSNILDAICFALGLTTLSLARVNNLQELVYQNAQAGIDKASVTIVFDNRDRRNSPIGFEQCKTISISRTIQGGKSKYLIDGHVAPQTKIKGLFRTLQLNIDNPHFLVSQGKITKLVYLKPSSLIGLLEEAAGTALFNVHKKDAIRILEKKEEKLRSIDVILKIDIEPQMEKLRKEQELLRKYRSIDVELEQLKNFMYAYEYYEQRKLIENRNLDLTTSISAENELQKKMIKNEEKLEKLAADLIEIKAQREKDKIKFKEVKALCKHHKKEISDLEFEISNLEGNLKDSEKEKDKIEKRIIELESEITRFDQKFTFVDSNLGKLVKSLEEKKFQLETWERELEAFQKGELVTTQDRLIMRIKETESKLNTILSEIKRNGLKKHHMEQELDQTVTKMEKALRSTQKLEKEKDSLSTIIEGLKAEVNKYNISNDEYQDMMDNLKNHNNQVNSLNLKLNEMIANNLAFKLNYKDPYPNFDRKKVKGRVFQLFSVNDATFIRALEATAGDELFGLVVDSEDTVVDLAKKKVFGNSPYILIPNTVTSRSFTEDVVARAVITAKVMNGNAALALSLIKYDPDIKPIMQHIFGNTFVCSSTDIALAIAFDPKINCRCVTLDGEVIDPSGTFTGGYNNLNYSILERYSSYRKLLIEYDEKRKATKQFEEKCDAYKVELDKYNNLKTDLDLKNHQVELLEKKIKGFGAVKLKEKVESLHLQLKDLNDQIDLLENQKRDVQNELNDLKQQKLSGEKMKLTEENLLAQKDKCQQEIAKIQADIKKLKSERMSLEVEKEQNIKEIDKKKIDFQLEVINSAKFKDSIEASAKHLEEVKYEFSKAEEERKELDKTVSSQDSKINKMEKEEGRLKAENNKLEGEIQRVKEKIAQLKEQIDEAYDKVGAMEKTAPWLLKEYRNFGVAGTQYDFECIDIEYEKKRYHTLKDEEENLSKRVNAHIEAQYDKIEKDYHSLLEKKRLLEIDKKSLIVTIEKLERKRKKTLERCYINVNRFLGRIFSSLLPGANAKIEPIESHDISEGVEIFVAFNNVWKKSLSELSGGQRSLLALSFLLALLLYKPAPFYILDEIDSALDLSHTENIGNIMSQYFPQSQFIVVSLKDEFYKHANVLFKVNLQDGSSRIETCILNPSPSLDGFLFRPELPFERSLFNFSSKRVNRALSKQSREEEDEISLLDQFE